MNLLRWLATWYPLVAAGAALVFTLIYPGFQW